ALRERGKPSDEERAVAISLQTFERTKIFKFRQGAGEVRIRQARRKVSSARQMLESAPGDETVKSIYETERQALLELEVAELRLCVENYPTDLTWKYELGRRYFELGNFEDAIGQFQEAQNDPRVRGRVLHMLGMSFLRCDLADEAVETLRRALEVPD
ncbi:MAG: tetratricopeptide repeat protein, partial [Phycisphaerae bacterium]